mgnify:CR=1 FL=1
MISGYCIGIKNNFAELTFAQEFKKVFLRLLLPYFVWSLIYIILSDKLVSIKYYLATFTLRGLAPLWFLATLAMCEICFFTTLKIIKKRKEKQGLLIFILIGAICLALGFAMQVIKTELDLSTDTMTTAGYYLYVSVGRLFISIPSYILGYLLVKTGFLKRVNKVASFVIGALLLAIVAILVAVFNLKTNCHLFYTSNYLLFIITSFAGAAGILLISRCIENFGMGLSFIGQNSLGLMILHYPPFKTISYTSNAVAHLWSNENFISISATVITTAITLGFIYLVKKKFFLFK